MGQRVGDSEPNACPSCRGHKVGRIGTRQYYCSDCYLEFSFRDGVFQLFEVDEDGNLRTVGELRRLGTRPAAHHKEEAKGSRKERPTTPVSPR